jgi:hypothetical protein
MKVKELIKKLQELPEDQQELEFKVCLGMSPECEVESFEKLYAQPEYKRMPGGVGRSNYVNTGNIAHIQADQWS